MINVLCIFLCSFIVLSNFLISQFKIKIFHILGKSFSSPKHPHHYLNWPTVPLYACKFSFLMCPLPQALLHRVPIIMLIRVNKGFTIKNFGHRNSFSPFLQSLSSAFFITASLRPLRALTVALQIRVKEIIHESIKGDERSQDKIMSM